MRIKKYNQTIYQLVFILVIVLSLTTCSLKHTSIDHRASTPTPATEVQRRILPLVEQLYLNTMELKEVYRDLRSVSQAHAFRGEDEQLNYVQKAALYVQKSHLSAMHQWEFLSLMEDIRTDAMVDYYTLRYKGLSQAIDASVGDERFIKIYRAYIKNAAAIQDIDAALKLIVDNRNLFEQLTAAIAPMVRQKGVDLQL